jgi:hypothetical protein
MIVETNLINFGVVNQGNDTGVQQYRIMNTGGDAMVIKEVVCEDKAINVHFPTAPLHAGQTAYIEFRVSPEKIGFFKTKAIIKSNTVGDENHAVYIKGFAKTPFSRTEIASDWLKN